MSIAILMNSQKVSSF